VDPVEELDISTVEAYNYATNSWTGKSATLRRARTNGVGLIGGKLYVSGGILDTGDGHEATLTVFAYDPIADVFTRKADMPRPASDGVTGVIGGKLYVLTGGCGNCAVFVSRRFWRYDPATNAWSFLPQCPRAHLSGAGGVINGKFYVAGGSNEAFSATKNLDVYDPVTNTWTARAPLPETVFAPAGAVLNNKLYVMGGTVGADSHTSKTVFAYDPATNTWTTKAPMLTARFRLAAAGLVTPFGNPKILAVGGLDLANPSAGGANELFTP
jgi:N-acetylneuraminic acid mutarotase